MKFYISFILLALLTGCGNRSEEKLCNLTITIDPLISYASVDSKKEYRENLTKWESEDFLYQLFTQKPTQSMPIVASNNIELIVGNSVIPLKIGINEVQFKSIIPGEISITNGKETYWLTSIEDDSHRTIKIGPGADIIGYTN